MFMANDLWSIQDQLNTFYQKKTEGQVDFTRKAGSPKKRIALPPQTEISYQGHCICLQAICLTTKDKGNKQNVRQVLKAWPIMD